MDRPNGNSVVMTVVYLLYLVWLRVVGKFSRRPKETSDAEQANPLSGLGQQFIGLGQAQAVVLSNLAAQQQAGALHMAAQQQAAQFSQTALQQQAAFSGQANRLSGMGGITGANQSSDRWRFGILYGAKVQRISEPPSQRSPLRLVTVDGKRV